METIWTDLDRLNSLDALHVAHQQHLAQVAKDQAYERLMAAQFAWRTGFVRMRDLRPMDCEYSAAKVEFDLLDDEYQEAKLAYQPYCPHDHVIPFQVGNFHFDESGVWDDIKDTVICADCGLDMMNIHDDIVPQELPA